MTRFAKSTCTIFTPKPKCSSHTSDVHSYHSAGFCNYFSGALLIHSRLHTTVALLQQLLWTQPDSNSQLGTSQQVFSVDRQHSLGQATAHVPPLCSCCYGLPTHFPSLLLLSSLIEGGEGGFNHPNFRWYRFTLVMLYFTTWLGVWKTRNAGTTWISRNRQILRLGSCASSNNTNYQTR